MKKFYGVSPRLLTTASEMPWDAPDDINAVAEYFRTVISRWYPEARK